MWFLVALALLWVVPRPGRKDKRREIPRDVDPAVVLDLAAAVLRAGASIPAMLTSVSMALGETGKLDVVGKMLVYGASWDDAWRDVSRYAMLREALRPAWTDGAAPVPLLERSARTFRLSRQRRAKEAAARLGAKLVVPLGLCFLPAFILLGVVPVVFSAAMTLL